MSAIAVSGSVTSIVPSIFDDDQTSPVLKSVEGRCVRATAREAARHWMARPSCMLESARNDNLFDYAPVPLKVVGTARVKYVFSGHFQPCRYGGRSETD